MAPFVSVLLPVRNAQTTLPRAIESILSQSMTNFELLMANDNSEDDSRVVMHQFAAVDDRVRCFDLTGARGVVAASSLLARHSTGEFIARMDADDVSLPKRLDSQIEYLKKHSHLSACGCLVEIVDGGEGFDRYADWLNSVVSPEAILAERFIESPVVNPTLLIRRDDFESLGGWKETSWAEDYDLILRALETGYLIGKVPEALFEWHDSPGRLTRSDDRYSEESFLRCKAHYLSHVEGVLARGVCISGAGPIGKKIARYLIDEGIFVHAFLDVNKRRVGDVIGGIPVLPAEPVRSPELDSPIQLIALGRPVHRALARKLFDNAGWVEGVNYYCVA